MSGLQDKKLHGMYLRTAKLGKTRGFVGALHHRWQECIRQVPSPLFPTAAKGSSKEKHRRWQQAPVIVPARSVGRRPTGHASQILDGVVDNVAFPSFHKQMFMHVSLQFASGCPCIQPWGDCQKNIRRHLQKHRRIAARRQFIRCIREGRTRHVTGGRCCEDQAQAPAGRSTNGLRVGMLRRQLQFPLSSASVRQPCSRTVRASATPGICSLGSQCAGCFK